MIEVKNLTKRFGPKVVLRGLDFQVNQGDFVALLGPNGAGKTTFVRILASLSRPLTGLVRIAGYQLPGQSAAVRKRLGFVSHLPLLYGDLTAEENLSFFGQIYSVPDLQNRICEVLSLVGLDKRKRDLVRTFSRGMQQRLAIGRAVPEFISVAFFSVTSYIFYILVYPTHFSIICPIYLSILVAIIVIRVVTITSKSILSPDNEFLNWFPGAKKQQL